MNARRWGFVGGAGLMCVVVACSASDPAAAPVADQTCDTYCTRVTTECSTGDDQMYEDKATCLSVCKALAPATETGKSGNTVNCRIGQLDAKNCRGAGLLGGGVCGDRCDGFCKVVQAACGTSAAPPYPDFGTCVEECNRSLTFDPNAPEGFKQAFSGADTLNCRVQHLQLAFMTPTPHCGHVGIQSAQCKASNVDAGSP